MQYKSYEIQVESNILLESTRKKKTQMLETVKYIHIQNATICLIVYNHQKETT